MVHQLCRIKGMKLKEVAEAMDRSPATLSQNLAKDKPKPSTFVKLAKAFGMDAADLEKLYFNPDKYEITHSTPISLSHDSRDIDVSVKPVMENTHTSHNLFDGAESIRKWDDIDIIDEDTGDVVSEKKPRRKNVSARINYNGTILFADSVQDIKDIANILLSIESSTDAEQQEAMLSLLVKQHGKVGR